MRGRTSCVACVRELDMVLHYRIPRAVYGLGIVLLPVIFCVLSAVIGAQQTAPAQAANRIPEITQALRGQQFRVALERSTEALRTTPRDPRLWTLQAMSYQGLHRTSDALGSFRKALGIAPDFLPALQGAAELSYAAHDPHTDELLG